MSQELPTAHGAEDEATTTAPAKPEKKVRIVTLEDGTQANFGVRANVLSIIDVKSSTLTFKIVTGKVINWTIAGVESLTEFQKTVFMYGLLEKIKTSLSPIKLAGLEDAIAKQIVSLEKGEFSVRSLTTVGEVSLTTLQQAYAIAFSKQYPDKANWANVEDPTVIAEVLSVWENKTNSQRNLVRRHPAVAWELNVMAIAKGDAEELSSL